MSFRYLSLPLLCVIALKFVFNQSALAQDAGSKKNLRLEFSDDWTFSAVTGFYGYSVEGKRSEAQIGGIDLGVEVLNTISKNLELTVNAGLRLENGSHKSLDVAEFSPDQQVLLSEGLIKYTPFQAIELKVGAINQKHFQSPLFIDATAFMGASQKWIIKWGEYQLFLQAQQLIPNNRNLSTRLATIDEGTPQFFSETIGLELGGDIARFSLVTSLFAFSKLSNAVAHQSRFMGNSVTGVGADAAELVYSYKGNNTYAMFWFNISQAFALKIDGHYTYNSQAPDNRNTAYLTRASLEFEKWTFSGQYFESQSDASVAFYNERFLGHNNRRGHGIGASFDEGRGNLQIDFIQSRPLEFNIFQAKSSSVIFRFSREIM